MSDTFYTSPILNSPYERPARHWELAGDDTPGLSKGQPTGKIVPDRRRADFETPIARAKRKKSGGESGGGQLTFADELLLKYDPKGWVNEIRADIEVWRRIQIPALWKVTPETAQLLQHWRDPNFQGVRPFYCQVEAMETLIWLTEVAPSDVRGKKLLARLNEVNVEMNDALPRLALKLATGAGKTTVMAMLIAWQTINAVRRPRDKRFNKGFLVLAPGITVRERLQVLLPNHDESYFADHRNLVPRHLRHDLQHAKVVVTNYHALKLRDRGELAAGTRRLLQGRTGEPVVTLETPGEMVRRVAGDLMGLGGIVVMNDEAHHCYLARPDFENDLEELSADERSEARDAISEAGVWFEGLRTFRSVLGADRIARVLDLSATPFFLSGSGYRQGSVFPWTASDFSLMDAIECGIVKMPRVPIADDATVDDPPKYLKLWDLVGTEMGRRASRANGPPILPAELEGALRALYRHYETVSKVWEDQKIAVPPCFIVVCSNTAASKLVYEWIAGTAVDGSVTGTLGALPLFSNFDRNNQRLDQPPTVLIDSRQLESGEALTNEFRKASAGTIAKFKDQLKRSGKLGHQELDDATILREMLNTVGKEGKLGANIRCVVSVSMLTEGWDANTVTHICGVRAFSTQLLCEQVVGRALRRQNYEIQASTGHYAPEYADIFGVPFDFASKPQAATVLPPKPRKHVFAVIPDRDHLAISYPNVIGYQAAPAPSNMTADFTADSALHLTRNVLGPMRTRNSGVIGQTVDLSALPDEERREATIALELTGFLVRHKRLDDAGNPEYAIFSEYHAIVKTWLRNYLTVGPGVRRDEVLYDEMKERAAERIALAISRSEAAAGRPVLARLDPLEERVSTRVVNYFSAEDRLFEPRADKCHINFLAMDSDWERTAAKLIEDHPATFSYVKNHSLGFEVPYSWRGDTRHYRPDFVVRLADDAGGPVDRYLVVEVKGEREDDDLVKAETMSAHWLPGVNRRARFGHWGFVELKNPKTFAAELDAALRALANA
jgi:type III restriction enzyme